VKHIRPPKAQHPAWRYFVNLWLAVDQLGNTILFGSPDETISSRLGKLKERKGGRIPWSRPISKIVDWGLEQIDPGHSIDAIERDEGDRDIWRNLRG
jgi:hypothetical protein